MSFRSVEKSNRFPNVVLSEQDIEEILKRAIQSRILDFSGANLSGEQPFFIADIITSNRFFSFVHADLSSTKITTKGFEAIVISALDLQSLENFIAKDNNLSKDVGLVLSKLVGAKGSLKLLDLSNNNLGDIGIASIAGIFGMIHSFATSQGESLSMCSLTIVDISNNGFGDAGVSALCRGLTSLLKQQSVVSLKILRMNQNKLTDKAAICLSQLLNTRPNSNQLVLNLEELSVSDNPALTCKGMNALLGNASEGILSPLKKLFMSRAQPNLTVLQQLAVNIRNGRSRLEHVGVEFLESVCNEVIRESAVKFNKMENAYSGYTSLSGTVKQLCDSFSAAAATPSGAVIRRVDLGALPRTVFNSCVYATKNKLVTQYQDTLKALDYLNAGSDVFGLQYISHVKSWVADCVYENRPHYGLRPVRSVRDLDNASVETISSEVTNNGNTKNGINTTSSSNNSNSSSRTVTKTSSSSTVTTSSQFSSQSSNAVSASTPGPSSGSAALAAAVALKESMERIIPNSGTDNNASGSSGSFKSSFLSNFQSQLNSPASSVGTTGLIADSQRTSPIETFTPKAKQNGVFPEFAAAASKSNSSFRGVNTEPVAVSRNGTTMKVSPESGKDNKQLEKLYSKQDLLDSSPIAVSGGHGHSKSGPNLTLHQDVAKTKTNITTSSSNSSSFHSATGRTVSPNQRRFMEHLNAGGKSGQRNEIGNSNSNSFNSVGTQAASGNDIKNPSPLTMTPQPAATVVKNSSQPPPPPPPRVTTSTTAETQSSQTLASKSSDALELEQQEEEYLQMRKDRSTALHTLANEIQLLMESSPTRAETEQNHNRLGLLSSTSGEELSFDEEVNSSHVHHQLNNLGRLDRNYSDSNKEAAASDVQQPSQSINNQQDAEAMFTPQVSHAHSKTETEVFTLHTSETHTDNKRSNIDSYFGVSMSVPQSVTSTPDVRGGYMHINELNTFRESNLTADNKSNSTIQPTVSIQTQQQQTQQQQTQQQQTQQQQTQQQQTHIPLQQHRHVSPQSTRPGISSDEYHEQPQSAFPRHNPPNNAFNSVESVPSVSNTEFKLQTGKLSEEVQALTVLNNSTQQYLSLLVAQVKSMEIRQTTSEGALFARLTVIESRLDKLEAAQREALLTIRREVSERSASQSVNKNDSTIGNNAAELAALQETVATLSASVARTNKLLLQQQQSARVNVEEAAEVHKSLGQRIMNGIASQLEPIDLSPSKPLATTGPASPSALHGVAPLTSGNAAIVSELSARLEQLEHTLMHEKQKSFASMNQLLQIQQEQHEQWRHEKQQHRHELFQILSHNQALQQENALIVQQQSGFTSDTTGQSSSEHHQNTTLRDRREQQSGSGEKNKSTRRVLSFLETQDLGSDSEYERELDSHPHAVVSRTANSPHHHNPYREHVKQPVPHQQPSRGGHKTAIAEYLPADYQNTLDGPKYSDDPAQLNPPLHKHQQYHPSGVRVKASGASYLRSIKAVPALPNLPLLPSETPLSERLGSHSDNSVTQHNEHQGQHDVRYSLQITHSEDSRDERFPSRGKQRGSGNVLSMSLDSDRDRPYHAPVMPEYQYDTLQPGGIHKGNKMHAVHGSHSQQLQNSRNEAPPPHTVRKDGGGHYSHTVPPSSAQIGVNNEHHGPPPLPPTSSFKPAFMVPTSSSQTKTSSRNR